MNQDEIEKYIQEVYKQSQKEVQKKWNNFMAEAKERTSDAWSAYLDAKKGGNPDEINKAYEKWKRANKNALFGNKRYKSLINEVSEQFTNANQTATSFVNGKLGDIYALNYTEMEKIIQNQLETGVSFELTDRNTLKNLLSDPKQDLLPTKEVNIPKDLRWNKKILTSQLLQGIIQGETIPEIAKRLNNVTDMTCKGAIRNARTMMTSAQNKGRMDSMSSTKDKGVILQKIWIPAHDKRTRATHLFNGGLGPVDLDFEFPNGVKYPADPDGPAGEVYNCRCALGTKVLGFKSITKPEKSVDNSANKKYNDDIDLDVKNHSDEYKKLKDIATRNKIEYKKVKKLQKQLTDDEIVQKLAGGDLTVGSCSSLAFAYCGTKNGIDILDFRGGESQRMFSSNFNIREMLNLSGIKSQFIEVKRECKEGAEILKQLPFDKEYYFAIGRHAAIVKNTVDGPQYLELQSAIKNGWKSFTNPDEGITRTVAETLKKRFGASKTQRSVLGYKLTSSVMMAEVDSFKGNKEFFDLLGYINTDESNQKKGNKGYAK